jgi:O-antigen ligase
VVKWVVLAFLAALVWPVSVRLRSHPEERLKILVLAGFLPFILRNAHLFWAIISWDWVGYVKGLEVSLLDFIALAVYISLPSPRGRLPFLVSMILYFLATVLSAAQARLPITALFYSWQLARMFLLYATVYRGVCADQRIASAILKGMAAGLLMEAGLTIWQRFVLGVLQTPVTFPAQNGLGLASHFVIYPFFALLLAGRGGWLSPAVVTAGLVAQVLTTSRGTVLLGAVGLATVFSLSALRRWTSRKGLVLLAGVAAIAVFGPLAASSFEQRFEGGPMSLQEDSERVAYKKAADMMLSEHPLGIGANNFTFVANVEGYFSRAGEASYLSGLSGNVHNVYWLVASETGYLGLVTFVILLLRPLAVAFFCGLRHLGDPRADLLVGLGVALLIEYLHCSEEWAFVNFETQYLYAIDVGLVAGLAATLGYWRRQ